jgi:LysM domain-containing protein
MPEQITCFACEKEPAQQCPRCGRPYCKDHGEEVCNVCLEPASGVPSVSLYRGSLLALLIATALAAWLILQPPGETADSAVAPRNAPTLPAIADVTATLPAVGPTSTTPLARETPGARTTTPAAGQGTPGPGGTTTYTVQDGDTVFGICSDRSSLNPSECVERVLELNSITDPASIGVGDMLTIPQ